MSDRVVALEVAGDDKLARDLVAGGVFVPGAALPLNEECELVLRGAGDEVRVRALVVFANAGGIGLQLSDTSAEMKQRIGALVGAAPAAAEPEATEPAELSAEDEAEIKKHGNVHQRLRGLNMAEQVKIAKSGEVSERVVLERLYGKNVWEPLLRNPRLTGPEVARIARMGALPRTMIEIIVGNGGWLAIPEVRRALLTNPRIGTDHIVRILRLLPKHELKLAAQQTAYPFAVRDVAKRLLKDAEK